ncbi:1886_t:CDS:2 [Ambispora gerdemannii]|uniref:1886_t:CDS:1 n=1 Tax=Ambispora gerdemannii TaxID=144530 RepID=A0A9N8VYV5_9GLOM|nr:1886_t:CDS:2 [Ambispora gerdemannii]
MSHQELKVNGTISTIKGIGTSGPFFYPLQNPETGTTISENPPALFQPLTIRGVKFANRVVVSPMCMYSCKDGSLTDFHLAHLGQFALRGAGLIFVEATAVLPNGRISTEDSGIWDDKHVGPLKRVVDFVHSQGVKIGLQIAHAGRKASTRSPFTVEQNPQLTMLVPKEDNGWPDNVVGPSPIPWDSEHATPNQLSIDEIQEIIDAFGKAAERAIEAGFDVLELHFAHGYLLSEFFSPLSNERTDEYGGNFENRIRFGLEIAERVRTIWPTDRPLFARVSATEWVDNNEQSWNIDQTVELAKSLKVLGVDLIDCSSGGNISYQRIPVTPSFQVPFAERVRKEADIKTGAVGKITEAHQANEIVEQKQADLVFIGRAFLNNAGWVQKAAQQLGVKIAWPVQYHRRGNYQL